jgi:sec-independent protein translocase protein TatA
MGAIGPWQVIIILIIAVLLFGGGGRLSSMMGDFAKGIKSFRKGLKEGEEDEKKSLEKRSDAAVDVTPTKEREKTGV